MRTNRKHYRISDPINISSTVTEEGILYSRMSKKWVVKVYKKLHKNRVMLCSLAAFEKKEDAQKCYDDYKELNPVTV